MHLGWGNQFPLILGSCGVALASATSTPSARADAPRGARAIVAARSTSLGLAINKTSTGFYECHDPRAGRTRSRAARPAATVADLSEATGRWALVSQVQDPAKALTPRGDGNTRTHLVEAHLLLAAAVDRRRANTSKTASIATHGEETCCRHRATDCHGSRCLTVIALVPHSALARGPPNGCRVYHTF
jgi:hypothetical protein